MLHVPVKCNLPLNSTTFIFRTICIRSRATSYWTRSQLTFDVQILRIFIPFDTLLMFVNKYIISIALWIVFELKACLETQQRSCLFETMLRILKCTVAVT